jgi:hypothetical protein
MSGMFRRVWIIQSVYVYVCERGIGSCGVPIDSSGPTHDASKPHYSSSPTICHTFSVATKSAVSNSVNVLI